MQEIQISDIVDINGSFKQIDELIAYIDKLDKRIQEINKGQIKVGSIQTLRELKQVINDLQQASKELNSIINQTNKTQSAANEVKKESLKINKEASQAQVAEAKAAKETEAAKKTAAQVEKELALAKKLEAQTLKELAAAEKLESQAVKEGNAAKKIQAQTAKEIALTKVAEAKALKELYQVELIEAKTANEVAKAKKGETQEREKAEKAAKAEQKAIDDIANDYKQLSLAYNEAALRAKNLAIRFGENHPLAQEAIKDAKDLKTFLDRIDQATGDYRRNVGNYSGAFDGLRNSMQQILREAPSLAVNLNTFFLAISNNLPQFFDAIEQAKKANEGLAESGQKPVPVFKQIVNGLFSMQSALTIGITLITLYGTKLIDWFNSIGKGGGSIDRLKKQLAGFNAEVEQASEDLDLFFKYLDRLNKAPKVQLQIDNTNVPVLKAMENDLKALGKEAEDAQQRLNLKFDEFNKATEAQGKIAQMFDRLGSKDAKEAFKLGITDNIKDKLSERDNLLIEALKKANQDYTKADEEVSDLKTTLDVTNKNIDLKAAEIAKESGEQARQIVLDNANYIYNITKASNDNVLASDRSTLRDRLNALRSNFEAEKNIIAARKRDVLSDPTSSNADRNAAIKQALSDEKNARLSFERDIFNEKESFRLRDLEADKSMYVRQKELQSAAYKELAQILEFSLRDRLQLEQNYLDAQKDKIKEEYNFRLQQAGLTDEQIKKFQQDKNYDPTKKNDPLNPKGVKATYKELLEIASDYESQVLNLSIDTNKAITEQIKNEIEKQQGLREEDVKQIERIYSQLDLSSTNKYAEDVIALNDSLAKKEISIATYNKRRKELDRKFSKDTINNTINEVLAQLRVYDGAEARLSASEIKLSALRDKYDAAKTDEGRKQIAQEIDVANKEYNVAKGLVDDKIKLEKDLTGAKKEESDNRKKIAEEEAAENRAALASILGGAATFGTATQTLNDGAFNKRMQQIQEEKDALEERYNHEKELIEQTTLSDIEKKQKLAEADARYNGQKKALEQQEKQERLKKAQFDKQAAIFNIIINTARAVVEALPNIPKALSIGVTGAAELAVALSAPLPRFFKGKNLNRTSANDSYEGYALVDDGADGKGKAELIIREDGSMEVGTDQPRVTYLSRNDIVIPEGEKAKERLMKSISSNSKTESIFNNSLITKEYLMQRTLAFTQSATIPYVNFTYSNDAEIRLMERQNNIMNKGFNKLDSRLKHLNSGSNKPKVNWHELWFIQDSLKKLNGN